MVAALISTFVVGSLASGVPHFFRSLGTTYVASMLLLGSPITPPVYPGHPYALVNGSLWTIAYECRCYLLIALLGALRLVRRSIWLGACALFFLFMLNEHLQRYFLWHGFLLVTGVPEFFFRFTPIFFLGGCFYLFKDRIPFRPSLAILAAVGFVLLVPRARISEAAMVICGGYLLFYLGRMPSHVLERLKFPDISYGIYLYGWPVEGLWIWYFHGSPWVTFLGSTVICCGLGWLSWHFIERPMLAFQK
jgi:peptidoglycan/LPS O-acetylase OafA/YrhL